MNRILRKALLPGLAFIVLVILLGAMAGLFRDKIEPALEDLPEAAASDVVAAIRVETDNFLSFTGFK